MVSHSCVLRLSVLFVLFIASFCTYSIYFRHPPPAVLIELNKNIGADRKGFGIHSFNGHDSEKSNMDLAPGGDEKDVQQDKQDMEDMVEDANYWDNLIRRNNFVAVGAVYDKCDGHRTQFGTVILEEDKQDGGVLTRTLFNLTLENELSGGEFHLQVKYNGRDLYDNYWELCELEDQLPVENRTFTCPVAPGKLSRQTIKHVPSYLPAGRYQTKAWVLDDKQRMIACGFSDFKI